MHNITSSKKLFWIILISLFGLFLRVYKISSIPNGFFCDEAATGFNAYTIFTTSKDEYGKTFPVFFYSFGNNRLPLPIYMAVPFVAVFGLSEFSSRLSTAFYGTLTIPLVFLLLSALFPKRKYIGAIGALLLAIAPWHVHFSRTAHEYIHLPFFILLGITLIVFAIKRKQIPMLYFGFISLSLAFYTYFPSYLMVPLVFGLVVVLYFKKLLMFKKHFLLAIISFFVISVPLISGVMDGRALTRWKDGGVSVFSEYRTPREVLKKVVISYALHFSPQFLLTKGDIDFPGQFITRHSVRGMGMLYWFEVPLIFAALIHIISKRSKGGIFLLGILLIHPLGNAVTSTLNPYAPRSILGSVAWPMISALGLTVLLDYGKKIKLLIITIFVIAVAFFFTSYLVKYYQEYSLYSSGYYGWQSGPKDIMKIFLKEKNNYDDLIIVGDFNAPSIFLKFYDPNGTCWNKCKIGEIRESYLPQRRQLWAISVDKLDDIPTHLSLVSKGILYYPNGSPSFLIAELVRK